MHTDAHILACMQKTCERTCIHFRDVHLHTKHINTHTHTHTHTHAYAGGGHGAAGVLASGARGDDAPAVAHDGLEPASPQLADSLAWGGAQGYVNPVFAASVALKFKRFTYICVYMYDTYVIYVYICMCICV